MPKYLDTRGSAVLSIAVCDRCKMKRKYVDLRSDPNFNGLRVCVYGCIDEFDPWRLPARKTESITLQYPRPDINIALDANGNPVNP